MPHLNMPMTREELAQRIYVARLATKKNAKPPKLIREVEYAFMAANIFMEKLEAAEKLKEEIKAEIEKVKEQRPSEPITVHILKAGFPICGFSNKQPSEWAKNQKWVATLQELHKPVNSGAPCEVCLEKAKAATK